MIRENIMTKDNLSQILANASNVPECPTDKFVDAFIAQMETDNVVSANDNVKKHKLLWAGGLVAAGLVLAVGIVSTNQYGNLFAKPKVTMVATQNDNIAVSTADDSNQNLADDFAAQMIGYDDISTIVPVDDL